MSLASVLLKKIPLDANWKITRKDPRLPFLALLWAYILVGITLLGFNRSPWQILFTIGLAAALDMLLHFVFRRRTLLCPLSAIISASSLSILMNYAHGAFLAVLPVFFTIASKYVLTFRGRHVYNPSLAGIVLSLLFSQHMISAAPAYQWGGSPAVAVFIVSAALVLFVFRIGRWPLIVSFLLSYAANVAIRAYITRHHVPPEMLVMGTLTSPAFYLFTFFMITDPGTSPPNPRLQVAMGFLVALIDLILHRFYTLNTIFYAAFVVFSLRFAYLHIHRFVTDKSERGRQSMSTGRHVLAQSAPLILIGVLILIGFRGMYGSQMSGMRNVPFQLRGIPTQHSGLQGRPGDLLAKVDPRMANVGKWLLSVGDGAFVADVNNDGWMDVFLTNPMKHRDDRAALYLNRGAFRFERLPVPVLREIAYHPESRGVIAGALFYDADNDGDPDLLLSLGYGQSRLLRNDFIETGRVQFRDISEAAGITEYTISIDANALDWNRDGRLDILLANAIGPYLRDYNPPRRFNIFQLPPPEYAGDHRMLNVMHRTWHNANNAGPNFLYESRAGECDSICYHKLDNNRIGLEGERWTLDVATTDFNDDGYTDLYLANDFGPDQIFINESGRRLRSVRGPLVGQPGHDTYKGMNASAGDVNNDGKMDIYVSNVHQRLQAEGSLLWLNNGRIDADGYAALEDAAGARNALNEHRFGWGGALADMDLDGRLDILQANGHIDDSYDNLYEGCPDYWYWNDKIGLTAPDTHGYSDAWADLRGRCIYPYERDRIYLNQGRNFVDVSAQVGLTARIPSRAMTTADFDNDGDLDLLVSHQFAPPALYANDFVECDSVTNVGDCHAKHWIGLLLEGNARDCNRDALGTRAVIEMEGLRQVREVTASNGLSAQNDVRLLFGLGALNGLTAQKPVASDEATGLINVSVHWCGAEQAQRYVLQSNRYHHLIQDAHE